MQTTQTEVHKIILQQLGGNKFLVMTGSKNLGYSSQENNYLSMKLTANKLKAQYLKIVLNADDTYTMIFSKVKKEYEKIGNFKFCTNETTIIIKEINGVYCDTLQETFTENTGLFTKF